MYVVKPPQDVIAKTQITQHNDRTLLNDTLRYTTDKVKAYIFIPNLTTPPRNTRKQ